MGHTIGIKLVVVGDNIHEPGGGKAKTILLKSYVDNVYPEDYRSTVFDNYAVYFTAGEDIIELGLWDTSGQEEYDRLRPLSYVNANIFLVIFSVGDSASYENVSCKWIPELRHFHPNVPIILVGCQTELRNHKECITPEQGQSLSKKVKTSQYLECSAKTGENVKQVFDIAIKVALQGKLRNAAIEGDTTGIDCLLAHGVNIYAQDYLGSALHYAAMGGHMAAIEYLVREGKVNAKDCDGNTPLHFSSGLSSTSISRSSLSSSSSTLFAPMRSSSFNPLGVQFDRYLQAHLDEVSVDIDSYDDRELPDESNPLPPESVEPLYAIPSSSEDISESEEELRSPFRFG